MGTLSNVGTIAGIVAFGAGILLGLNIGFEFPISWGVALLFGVIASATTSAAFEFADLRVRHPINTFGVHTIREVEDGVTVSDCYACSGADHDGYRVGWAKDRVVAGMVRERMGGGINEYCGPCHTDTIETGLRQGYEREFRKWWEASELDGHWMDALIDLRETYIDARFEADFWEWVADLRETADEWEDKHGRLTDPCLIASAEAARRPVDSTAEFFEELAGITGEDEADLRERFKDKWWLQHLGLAHPASSEDGWALNQSDVGVSPIRDAAAAGAADDHESASTEMEETEAEEQPSTEG